MSRDIVDGLGRVDRHLAKIEDFDMKLARIRRRLQRARHFLDQASTKIEDRPEFDPYSSDE